MLPKSAIRQGLLALGLALSLVLVLISWRPVTAQPQPEEAQALVQEVGDQVLVILEDQGLSDREKLDHLVPVLEGPIDLELVARLILGRHWRTASDDQRAQYLDLFRAYALDTLASRMHLYQGQEFEITNAQAVSDRDAVVTTRILSDEWAPLRVDWRLRENDGGDLVAIDVIVEGVSLIVSLRSEFSSVIERSGMDGLLAELRQRIERPA